MGIWSRLYYRLITLRVPEDQHQAKENYSNQELLKQAHLELMCAHNMFIRVIDEDMVDCAIYSINAAEKRYNYLIKKIRQESDSRQNAAVSSQL